MTAAEVLTNGLYDAYLACGLAGGIAGLTTGLLLCLAIVVHFHRREHRARPGASADIDTAWAGRDSTVAECDRGVSTGTDGDCARRAAG